jgi:predicted GIY-YIG superfamily endonuclease
MSEYGTVTFIGKSRKTYTFTAYSWDQEFKAVGAVYVITKRSPKSGGGMDHEPVYIGQTNDLSTRFDNHHKALCFKQKGANSKCVMVEETEKTRLAVESDLIDNYNAPCND